ncbi:MULTISPECIES: hypothetical protein [Pseudomonas]|uniref:Uncharacterized protein n=1 Tax=Pseudomonas fluorescens TaxID=294 RepID=A0A0D0NI99_PSEFL|nr:hypothetical protein [Pseudomonas fluorescens]KIQ58951.1 hypothetical protein RL74_13145 [Pseudomonas fluorescens]
MMNWFRTLTRTDAIATLALIVSIASAFFTYQQYRDSVASRKTPIIIRVGAEHTKVSFYKPYKDASVVLFKQRYKIILTNNSFNPESVIDWRIWERRENGGGEYLGMKSKLLDSTGAPMNLPFLIGAKESKVIFLDVGQKVTPDAWAAVGPHVGLDKEMDWFEADRLFADAGYPLFGQLTPGESSKHQGLQVDRWLAGPAYQEFQLNFSKADGYEVAAQLSLNVSDVYPQGEAER